MWLTSPVTHFLTDVSQGASPNLSKGWCTRELISTTLSLNSPYFFNFFSNYNHSLLNPQEPGEGEISLPHSRAIFSKLKNEDKDLFLLEIVRNDVKKHKMQLFPFLSHLT